MRTLRLLAVLLFAFPAFAVRFGFTLRTPTGKPVSGAEVCAFAGGESPVEQWFSGSGVDCFPASTVVAFPKGRWNVFAVVEGKYASTHPYLLVVRDDPPDADSGYREITIDLAPAATVSAEEPGRLYFPGTKKTLAFALPMLSKTATIPANLPFVPVRVRNGELRFGDAHAGAAAGARVVLDDFERPATGDAVAYLAAASRPPDALPAPQVELLSGGRPQTPLFAGGPLRDRDLVIFKSVSGGEGTLRLSGATWETAETAVKPGPATRVATIPALRLAPAAELRVRATTPVVEWLRRLDDPECSDGRKPSALELHCIGASCPAMRALPLVDGAATFASVPSGTYELRLGNTWKQPVTVSPGTHDVTLDLPLFTLAGSVTRNGKPVHARVVAGGGSALTGGGGAYAILFPKETDRAVIRDCAGDAEFVHLSEVPLSTLPKLDIELPSPLNVRVVDAATTKPIARARVHALVVDPGNPRAERFTEVLDPAGEDGAVTLRRMPLGKFSVCARAEDYAPRCVQNETSDPLVIALTRIETFAGVIEGLSAVKGGMLFFVTPDGAQSEAVSVDADGNFKHRRPHGANERAVFVSASHPLAVLSLPATGPLRLRVPAAPVRDVAIRTAADAEYELGVAIGAVIVPAGALARHQTMRGRMPFTANGEAVLLSLVESAPIVVYRGFSRLARPPHLPPGADPFAMPEVRAQFPSAIAGNGPLILP
ncbi:MAG TPA: hypothetical protein VEK11_13110 [Thermoanaerobaculia bacterium]|nr:hypothetical protein [Thermoanaerobaculia bacterium]